MTSMSTQRQGGRRASLLSRNAAVPKAIPDVPGEAVLDSAHIGDIVGAFGRIKLQSVHSCWCGYGVAVQRDDVEPVPRQRE